MPGGRDRPECRRRALRLTVDVEFERARLVERGSANSWVDEVIKSEGLAPIITGLIYKYASV